MIRMRFSIAGNRYRFLNPMNGKWQIANQGSQPRRGGLDGIRPGQVAFGSCLSFEDFVAAGDIELVEVRSAKTDVGEPRALGFWNDGDRATGLIADLKSEPRGHVESAFNIDGHPVGAGIGIAIGNAEM